MTQRNACSGLNSGLTESTRQKTQLLTLLQPRPAAHSRIIGHAVKPLKTSASIQ
jgi:hypothetical protein